VIKSRMARGRLELLVCWTRQAAAEATWVPAEEFRTLYPSYQLEDELLLQGGGEMSCAASSTSAAGRARHQQITSGIRGLRDKLV
jgi:hypothetical protein